MNTPETQPGGSLKPVGSGLPWTATKPPRCPECNSRMEYEDDRDDNGKLLNAWWHCPSCLNNEGISPNTERSHPPRVG